MSNEIEIVSQIASLFFKEPPVKITPLLEKGFVNKVFIVETLKAKAIVRTRDEAGALKEYRKEAWCIERASALGVPVPAVLALGSFEQNAYMIQPFLEGDEGRKSSKPKGHIWRKLGEYARLIHSIKVAGFGLNLSDLTAGDSQKSWLKYVGYNIESLCEDDELLKLGVLTNSESKKVRDVFENLRLQTFNFGLNHGDISLKNVIVDEGGNISLLDWGSAEASIVPHHDLIQLLKMNMLENDPDEADIGAFLDGYRISQTEFKRMMPELETLLLLRAFDKLRWAIDRKIENLESYASHAKAALARCLQGR